MYIGIDTDIYIQTFGKQTYFGQFLKVVEKKILRYSQRILICLML